jgi:hypothetical protein
MKNSEESTEERNNELMKCFKKRIIRIPGKFITLYEETEQEKNDGWLVMRGFPEDGFTIKIFAIEEKNLEKWYKGITEGDFTYPSLLSFIEEIRKENLHKQLPQNDSQIENLATSKNSFRTYNKTSWHFILGTSANKNIYNWNKKLAENESFLEDDLDKVNKFHRIILIKKWIESGFRGELPRPMLIKEVLKELDIQEFNDNADLGMNPEEFFKVTSLGGRPDEGLMSYRKRKFDAYEDFIFQLYEELFIDMLKSGKFKKCRNVPCSNLFQRKLNQTNRNWRDKRYCSRPCEQDTNKRVKRGKIN